MLQLLLIVHVAGAAVSLFAGMTSMAAAKGGPVHRRSGMVFAVAILTMCSAAVVIAVVRWNPLNIVAAMLTAYLAVTALTTLRPPSTAVRRLDRAMMALGLTVGIAAAAIGAGGGPYRVPLLMFALLGVLGAVGDIKARRTGRLAGAPRLARHLWRISLAMLIATMSFFLGPRARVQAVLPDVLVTTSVLMLPVLAVLATMLLWLYRVKRRGWARDAVGSMRAVSRTS